MAIHTRCHLRDAGVVVVEQPDLNSAMATCLSSLTMGVLGVPQVLVDGVVAYGAFLVRPGQVSLRKAIRRDK